LEHNARRQSIFHSEYQSWEAYPVDVSHPPPLPDKKDVHYDVVKQEADEYQAVLAVGYDQEALTH
jgi:hypothetical protein